MQNMKVFILVVVLGVICAELVFGAGCVWNARKNATLLALDTPRVSTPQDPWRRTSHQQLKTLRAPTPPGLAANYMLERQIQDLRRRLDRSPGNR